MATEQRLIDANALLKTGSGIKIAIRNDCHPYEAIRIQGNAFRKAVEQAPTIEASPVVHGRWMKAEVEAGDPFDGYNTYCFDVFMCSECGCHFDVSEAMNYCPNCGAKMEGRC